MDYLQLGESVRGYGICETYVIHFYVSRFGRRGVVCTGRALKSVAMAETRAMLLDSFLLAVPEQSGKYVSVL